MTEAMKDEAAKFFVEIQHAICCALEEVDGSGKFRSDIWERTDLNGSHGGGGDTRVLKNGTVFEQGGVNFSKVSGTLPADMGLKLLGKNEEAAFFATGTSLVIHPYSPKIPTVHANFRYLEVADKCWFGGGCDLTPHYLFADDARHFHSEIKKACDSHDQQYYPKFKKWCDEYFFLPHRGETRGVGGIFFDYLGRENPQDLEKIFAFVKDAARAFITSYVPIVEKRKSESFTKEEKAFQLLRRGRYVEFNLLYDRGTLFGLRTGGRTESILMSLPPNVYWEYDAKVSAGSREAELLEVLRSPREWV